MTATIEDQLGKTAAPRDPATRSRVMWVGVAIGTLIMIWQTRGAWTLAPVAGGDVMFHVIRADVGIDQLLFSGRIHGWSPRMYLGTDLFLFYGPGFVWMMALVRVLSFGLLDNGAALTVVTLCGFLALPVSVAFLARSLRLSHRASGLAAVLTALVSSTFGVGQQAVFGIGLVTQQVGAVLWILCLGCLVRLVQSDRRRWVTLTAVLFALHAVTSPVSMVSLVVVSLVAVLTVSSWPLSSSTLRRLALAGAVAFGLIAFWLFPAVAHADLAGGPTFWGPIYLADLIGQIFLGRLLFPVGVLIAVVLALIGMIRVRHYATRFLLVAPIVYFAFEAVSMSMGNQSVLVAAFRNHRALGLVGLLMLLPLAWAIDRLGLRWWPTGSAMKRQVPALVAIGLLVVLVQPSRLDRARPQDDPIPQFHATAAMLAAVVPDGSRFAYVPESDHGRRLGVQSPNLWLAQVSGKNLLNGTGLETTRASRALRIAHDVATVSPERSSRALIDFGTTHVVTSTLELAGTLEDSGLFEVVWQDAPMTILAVFPSEWGDPTWGLTGSGVDSSRVLGVANDRLSYLVESDRDTEIDLALAWSPHWTVRVDGREVVSSPTSDWRTRVPVRQGASVVELTYQIDSWERLGVVISVLTICAMWMVRRRSHVSTACKGGVCG